MGLLLLSAGTALAAALLAGSARKAAPIVHDESAYLLQARMLASGHLSMPSPPLPEFFEAPHVLVVPRYAAKYFPGHAAMLAPFVRLGVPWLGPSLLFGGTVALLFFALRLAKLPRLVALVAPLLLLANADAASAFAGYFSQSTSTFLCAAAVVAAAALWRRPAPGPSAALGACVAWAGLARPFTGVALGLAAAVLLLELRLARRLRLVLALAAPVVAAALVALVVSHQVTGAWTETPWSLYARQYVPVDGPGVGPAPEARPLRPLPPHMAELTDAVAASRRSYTAQRALAEVPRRLRLLAAPLPLFVLALVALGLLALTPPLRFALSFAVLDFVLLLDFHAVSALYLLEIVPMLLLLAAAGAGTALAALARLPPRIRPAARLLALGLAALWVGAVAQDELAERFRAVETAARRSHRFDAAFARAGAVRGLLFVRYPQAWHENEDWTYNEPDLGRAALLRVHDLGPRNRELMAALPDRPPFLLDLASGELSPLPRAGAPSSAR